ncbi:MAG: SWIM zinc finger family protein, partial [Planctomycetota bacterium]|nr:SWIM zinc finger family protein [Planctomycetota bacterium]
MAGTHPFLTKLRAILATQDDDALAALANKGLLRRAQKDLETQRPTLAEVTDTHVRLTTKEATVVIPELLVKSTCTCPASGICRHVLSALVALRDAQFMGGPYYAAPQSAQPAGSPVDSSATDVPPIVKSENRPETAPVDRAASVASPAEVLGSVSDEELQKWAGKATYRKGVTLLTNSPNRQVEAGSTLVVKFPDRNLVCRWIPSSGLVGMVCSCQAENVCEHVVAAVLAYQMALGREAVTAVDRVLAESSGAPRTRAEVLESVGNVLREIIVVGCSRMAPASSQRLTTLAVSAHGVDLPRLERQIRGLAKEV